MGPAAQVLGCFMGGASCLCSGALGPWSQAFVPTLGGPVLPIHPQDWVWRAEPRKVQVGSKVRWRQGQGADDQG